MQSSNIQSCKNNFNHSGVLYAWKTLSLLNILLNRSDILDIHYLPKVYQSSACSRPMPAAWTSPFHRSCFQSSAAGRTGSMTSHHNRCSICHQCPSCLCLLSCRAPLWRLLSAMYDHQTHCRRRHNCCCSMSSRGRMVTANWWFLVEPLHQWICSVHTLQHCWVRSWDRRCSGVLQDQQLLYPLQPARFYLTQSRQTYTPPGNDVRSRTPECLRCKTDVDNWRNSSFHCCHWHRKPDWLCAAYEHG